MRWKVLNFFRVGPLGFGFGEAGHGGAIGCHFVSRML